MNKMGANLHIHVLENKQIKEDYIIMHRNTLGSKYFDLRSKEDSERWNEAFERITKTDQVWVGEVSWLKAALFDDEKRFIPDSVAKISEIISENFPVVDEQLIEKIKEACELPNKTGYSLGSAEKILEFLGRNKGKQIFTMSW